MAGQLFNCFLALSFRILPLIGIGLVALSLFWPASLAAKAPVAPAGMIVLDDPVHTWAELIRHCRLPVGFVVCYLRSRLRPTRRPWLRLVNWGGSFVINDLYRPLDPAATVRREVWVSRLTTLLLFLAASVVAILFVKQMVGWFMFINWAMVIFLLPLAVFRFFWWRFNVWGELPAIVLGLPLSIFVWFVLDFQNSDVHPMWHGLGLLFFLSFVVFIAVTLVTPAESPETLKRFYEQCRPPGLWGPVRIDGCLLLRSAIHKFVVSKLCTGNPLLFDFGVGDECPLCFQLADVCNVFHAINRVQRGTYRSYTEESIVVGQPVVDCSAASSVACSPVN